MIIPLSLEDTGVVEQIWSLQHTAYRLEALAVGLTEYPPLPETFDSIRNSDELFYGQLSDDGGLIGAIATITEPVNGELEITRLMVHSDYLRQGIGTALVQYVLDSHAHITKFVVTAGISNTPAVALYKRHGFVPCEVVSYVAGTQLTLFRLNR
ncbi:Acetyltransferase (GNAT) family protein [Fontibacillus panacisegetis]|uniref:Acetyltransferase (GNAT) family protein n=1 Tax=Fontibacillus panacisegetis TaxID=670482 RepID=A0A1G7UKH6_9BACL|nr:GNAT family N-acetyltransferase [Fontibacillus panacisegetis]SDG47993.1 Acetyltransferase (GNAT) family protein [Fontibacillus panacisegetis]